MQVVLEGRSSSQGVSVLGENCNIICIGKNVCIRVGRKRNVMKEEIEK